MEVYLIRHTSVAVPKSICYGQTDVPLADTFLTEKEAVLKLLPDLTHAVVYSSPAQRCTQLAGCISDAYQIHPHLQEIHFGNWEGRAWDEIPPEELNPWMENFVSVCPPNGESFQQLYTRSTQVLKQWQNTVSGPLILVTHAGVIRSLLCYSRQVPLQDAFQFAVDYGSVTKIHFFCRGE